MDLDCQDVKGPYTSVSLTPKSVWYGKATQNVYDSKGIPLCIIPRIYHYDRDKKVAKTIAAAIARALTEIGFEFSVEKMEGTNNLRTKVEMDVNLRDYFEDDFEDDIADDDDD